MSIDIKSFGDELGFVESGNSYSAINALGCWGKYQFCKDRRNEIAAALGITNLLYISDFLPSMQEMFFDYHIRDLEKYIIDNDLIRFIGSEITGKLNRIKSEINIYGLLAGSHLGGKYGLKEFLTKGKDKSDGSTWISDYVAYFSEKMKKKNLNLAITNAAIIAGLILSR